MTAKRKPVEPYIFLSLETIFTKSFSSAFLDPIIQQKEFHSTKLILPNEYTFTSPASSAAARKEDFGWQAICKNKWHEHKSYWYYNPVWLHSKRLRLLAMLMCKVKSHSPRLGELIFTDSQMDQCAFSCYSNYSWTKMAGTSLCSMLRSSKQVIVFLKLQYIWSTRVDRELRSHNEVMLNSGIRINFVVYSHMFRENWTTFNILIFNRLACPFDKELDWSTSSNKKEKKRLMLLAGHTDSLINNQRWRYQISAYNPIKNIRWHTWFISSLL